MLRSERNITTTVLPTLLIFLSLLIAGCGAGRKAPEAAEGSNAEPRVSTLPIASVARNQLNPRIALTWFENRTTLASPLMDEVFYNRMIPLLQEKSGNTRVILPGDVAYPKGLDGFSRDAFGRLDAFGLAVFSRQENLNAVVTGMVLDAAVSNELSGILLWKATEGRLRILLLVEVYSAETATKLFSRTFEYETEVTGKAPDSTEELRKADMPLVREALGELAEKIGNQVGDVLEGLPWRGYVTNVVDDRITLSSGAESGLKPGNMLRLYDSRVLDGLDGRKYFLPSDAIGHMQVTGVFQDRTEGTLLQGRQIGIYTFAAP